MDPPSLTYQEFGQETEIDNNLAEEQLTASTPDYVLGHFAFAPTTQTTVVTTTTTTTTTFPPLKLEDPPQLRDRDPKVYPLAASPTPSALKNFTFDVGGRQVTFREAENPDVEIEQACFRDPPFSTDQR